MAGAEYLLTVVGGGWAIHLAPLATDPERNGFPAVLPEWFEERSLLATRARYDVVALTDARWWPKTLCGRVWYSMAAGSAGPLSEVAWEALAPDCRRCMASIDRLLPSVPPDDRIEPLCDQIVQTVEQWGFAEVTDVPGDQAAAMRAAARASIRRVLGSGSRTYLADHLVRIDCPERLRLERTRMRHEELVVAHRAARREGRPVETPWRLSWRLFGA